MQTPGEIVDVFAERFFMFKQKLKNEGNDIPLTFFSSSIG